MSRMKQGALGVTVECSDDREAIEKLAQMVDGQTLELWEGSALHRAAAPGDKAGL